MKYLILISFLFLTILGNAQTIRVPWYEIEAAPDSGYIARSTSVDGDGAWYLPIYREGDTIAVWNPNTRKLEFRTKASILSGIPSGSGTIGTLTKWTGTNTIGDAAITENATRLSASLPFRLANIPTISLPGVPSSGDLLYNTTAGNLGFYGSSAWEYPVKSSYSTGLFTATRIPYADANGRLTDNTNLAYSGGILFVRNGQIAIGRTDNAGFYISGTTYSNEWVVFTGDAAQDPPYSGYGIKFQATNSTVSSNQGGLLLKYLNATASSTSVNSAGLFFSSQRWTGSASSAEGVELKTIRNSSSAGDYYYALRRGGTGGLNATSDISINGSNGYIGIGNNSAQRNLHVTGEVRITDLTTDTPTRVVGADADGDLGEITFSTLIDSLIANGLVTDNWFNSNGTYTAARTHDAAGYTTSITNNAGWSISGTGASSFRNTTGASVVNFIRNTGSNAVAGQTIANLQFQGVRSSSESTFARIDNIYLGDGTNRISALDFGTAEASSFGGQQLRLYGTGGDIKPVIIGFRVADYPSIYTASAFVTIAAKAGSDAFSVDSLGVRKFGIQEDGTLEANSYGDNNKTADDLSKTRSGLVLAPATDGTVYETGGILFTQTADGTVANTVTETTIVATGKGSATIPANYLTEVGRTVIIKATGYFTTDDAHTLQMRVDLGGTTIGDAGGITLPDLATGNEHWELEFVFTIRTTGVSGTAIGQGKFRFCEAIGGATNPCVESEMLNTSTFTVDTTIANALDVTAQWGTASSTSSITCTNLVIKAEN